VFLFASILTEWQYPFQWTTNHTMLYATDKIMEEFIYLLCIYLFIIYLFTYRFPKNTVSSAKHCRRSVTRKQQTVSSDISAVRIRVQTHPRLWDFPTPSLIFHQLLQLLKIWSTVFWSFSIPGGNRRHLNTVWHLTVPEPAAGRHIQIEYSCD